MSNIVPCPFCGAAGTDDEEGPGLHIMKVKDKFFPQCHTCLTVHGWQGFDSAEEAIDAWNRRVPLERCYSGDNLDKLTLEVQSILNPFILEDSKPDHAVQVAIRHVIDRLRQGVREQHEQRASEGSEAFGSTKNRE